MPAGRDRSQPPPQEGQSRQSPAQPVHDDLLAIVDERGRIRHEFTATAPNQIWLTDITEHRTAEGKLYLCAIKDCFSNKIVGYSIDSRMKSSLAVSALRNAIGSACPGRAPLSTPTEAANSGRKRLCAC